MRDYVKPKGTPQKEVKRDILILGVILIITVILLSIFPDKRAPVFTVSLNFCIEMISILPAVMILMGLFSVFVPKEMVVKYLGKAAGAKAIFLGILMGGTANRTFVCRLPYGFRFT